MHSQTVRGLRVSLIVWVSIGCLLAAAQLTADGRLRLPASQETNGADLGSMDSSFSYVAYPRDTMYDDSDAIVAGEVVYISGTQWNQDGGKPWGSADEGFGINYHTMDISLDQRIVDDIGLDDKMTITVLGNSPLDGIADHSLNVGDKIVVFVAKRELAWRGGFTRPIIRLLNAPQLSYLVQGADRLYHGIYSDQEQPVSVSLSDLVSQIKTRRSVLVQP